MTPADRLLFDALRRSAPRATAIGCVTTADAATALALPAVLGRTLDLLLTGEPATGWLACSAALLAALFLLDAAETVLTGTTTAHATARLRTRLVGHLLAAGPAGAARFSRGDLVTRGTALAAQAGTAPASAAALLSALALPVGGITALLLIDVRLAAVFLLGAPLLVLLLRAFARSSGDAVARYQQAQGLIAGRLAEALAGARTVAAAGTLERERARILGPLPQLSREGHRMWRVQGRATAQAAVLVPLLQLAVVATAGWLLADGQLTVGALLAAARYAVLASGIGVLTGRVAALVRARQAAVRLAEVHAVPAVPYGTAPLPDGPGTLELRGVSAVRDGRTVLSGVDLTVPGGATVAVVGRSGSGKSELARLAGKLAEPSTGTVLLDGLPLDTVDAASLRAAVGYAFERPALVGGTLAGTIGLGPAPPGHAVVLAAARAARADSFIRTLPEGYATPCADAPLSGGEVQRLGLARAFAHAGRLLILDDATSSLDTSTERQVTAVLFAPERTRTRLVVAHRATTAARADLVAWLDAGHLRALAPHARLWHDPAYRAVFTAPDAAPDAAAAPGADTTRPADAGTPAPTAAGTADAAPGTAGIAVEAADA
ncbi:ABC transporter ATP-binding protein [Streptomyces sp. JJ66]|uniref:ABC transporter transmembrane domain-containing protein n=1 Tax=Streptomyces sp. JJ66 TaxID=2803843 RepID=UPI001C5781C1|nr:ABC transporter ATP-binding protein [Streptomyces sp. JJ66]MBW1603470.1 ABC transporter ATP-binding protein [Streptomyces sp. JJ66]